jgi:hypothetical protein
MHVGTDVGALCRRCGDVWHVVVAVVDGRVAKVECKQCGARHGFRSSDADAASRNRRPRSGRVAGSLSRSRKSSIAPVKADPVRPPRSYDIADTYQAGDRIVHRNFGEGVVQQVSGPNKVIVLFGATEKTLVQGR